MSDRRPDGIYSSIDEEAYHSARDSLSVSGAKLLLPPSCPAKFRWEQDNERAPKKVWDFGHLAHLKVLGTGPAMFVLDPAIHGLTKDGKVSDTPAQTAMWKKAVAEARARHEVPVTIDNWDTAEAMASAVRAHPVAGPLFAEGAAEQSLYATDPATGVRLRGRTDWITVVDGRLTIVDYKTSTTANPAELVRKWWALGYHQQDDWYRSLAVALGLSDDPDFVFVCQEKAPPYVVTILRYDQDARAEGHRLNRLAIDTYARCVESDTWPSYSDATVSLSLPGWATRDLLVDQAAALIAELEAISG